MMSSTLLPADPSSSSSSSRMMMMSEPLLVLPSDETRKPPTTSLFPKAKSYLRIKCLLGGFVFGSILMEVLATEKKMLELYQQKEQQDASSAAAPAATDTTSTTGAVTNITISTSSEQAEEAMYATQRIQSFLSGHFWFETSFLYMDVLFILYLAPLLVVNSLFNNNNPFSSRRRGGPDFALVIQASNWIVGMVMGVLVSLTMMFGPQVFCQTLPGGLLTIVLCCILTCIFVSEEVVIFQVFEVFAAYWTNEEGAAEDIEQSSKEEGGDTFYIIANFV
jgi:hypothetical protein